MDKNENKKAVTYKITGNWGDQSKELKTKYSELTDEDVKTESVKKKEVTGKTEMKLSKKRDEVINIIGRKQFRRM